MRHKQSHQQKIFQRMALTPQMRHSIKLLGMSTKDLNEYIDSAIEANPFLKKKAISADATAFYPPRRPDDEHFGDPTAQSVPGAIFIPIF